MGSSNLRYLMEGKGFWSSDNKTQSLAQLLLMFTKAALRVCREVSLPLLVYLLAQQRFPTLCQEQLHLYIETQQQTVVLTAQDPHFRAQN